LTPGLGGPALLGLDRRRAVAVDLEIRVGQEHQVRLVMAVVVLFEHEHRRL
jgi:hypothetical protein